MPLGARLAHLGWAAGGLGAWQRFRAALRDPARVQARLLGQYIQANRDTAFGRAHGFDRIRSVADYQRLVPISTCDTLRPFIDRVAAGEAGVLTRDPVHRLSPSSGSTSAAKLVPYTRRLQRELGRAVDPWIASLYLNHPRLMGGPAYWSITPPALLRQMPASAIPVGFDEDSSYLGGARQRLARAALVAPPIPGGDFDVVAFRHATLSALLLARELRLISVWHPSFLTLLLDTLARDWHALLDAVARTDRARAAELRRRSPAHLAGVWPRLTLASCWADGPSASPAGALKERLSGIEMQPKGLMATEGVVTIPFGGLHPIAVRSHFFEFLDPDDRPRLVHELEPGADYGVLLTTGGGLYRYRLGDRVRVDGRVAATPSLRFLGKDDCVSDRVGEKLSDGFAATAIDALFPTGRRPRFAMLAPDETAHGLAYALFVDREAAGRPGLAAALECQLRRNPHYAWCVGLGQLAPARIVGVGEGAERAYVDACLARGLRLGDVKPVSLHVATGWREVLSS